MSAGSGPALRQQGQGKKRMTPRRIVRALMRYLGQFSPRTYWIAGGVMAVLIMAVLLIVVLKPAKHEPYAAITLPEVTPTQSLAPTFSPQPTPTLAPTDNPLDGHIIKTVGETNDILPAVQERLVALGYMDMPVGGYTTKYGPATKTAVRLFQIKNYADSLQWDGQLGPETYTLMMSDQAKAYYLGRGDGDERTKNITKLVDDVKKMQERLIELGYMDITRASGYYGESTAAAVQTFQQYHGLEKDGRAGAETLALLYSDAAMDAATGRQNDRSKWTPTPTVLMTPAS